MRRASIDLGTNTCLLLIAEVDATGVVLEIVSDHARIVRLGKGVDQTRSFRSDAMVRTLACLKDYRALCDQAGVRAEEVVAVATSQARDASNAAEYFDRVQRETGIHFRVLSGEDEARASFLGSLLPGMSPEGVAVLDIGGGSTELQTRTYGRSLDLGSVRFTERYLKSDPVTDAEFWSCREAVDQAIGAGWAKDEFANRELLAVAGTATTLAAWNLGLPQFDRDAIDRAVLTRGDLHRAVEELKFRTVAERKELAGIESERADVLLAGALIFWRTLENMGFRSARVSTRGLRFGVFRL